MQSFSRLVRHFGSVALKNTAQAQKVQLCIVIIYANATSAGSLKLMQYISLLGATLRTQYADTSSVRA
jgi:hypothetical protein